MFKVCALFTIGVLFLIEGYFSLLRNILPMDSTSSGSVDHVYYKVVETATVDELTISDLILYLLGVLLIGLSVFLYRGLNK